MKFRLLLLALGLVLVGGCNNTSEPEGDLAGIYTATIFKVTPSGQAEVDVLDAGGNLTIVITASNTTTGTLNIPASVMGGLTASMVGSVEVDGADVNFDLIVDSFVEEITWTRSGTELTVINESTGGARYTVTLSKQ